MGFFLFILVNAALFIRPAELFGIDELEKVYLVMILTCVAVSFPELLGRLTGQSVDLQPMTLFVFGILFTAPLAFLVSFNLDEAYRTSFYFGKVVVYYLLLITLINSSWRLKVFLRWVLVFSLILALLSVLSMHGVIQLQSMKTLADSEIDRATGELRAVERLQGTGIFNDPNEMCVILAAMVPLCLFVFTDKKTPGQKVLWLATLVVFVYAMALTKSRGGFLAFVGGLGVLGAFRYGWKKTAVLGFVALPLLLVVFGGRQTENPFAAGTAKTRVELWSDWMMKFRASPLWGEGLPLPPEKKDLAFDVPNEHLAHNSYLQGFADLGVVGGVCFLGAFFLAVWSIARFGRTNRVILDPDLKRLQPYLLGSLAAYALGLVSLSLCYVVPTYMLLGLAVAFGNIAACYPALAPVRLNGQLVGRLALLSVGFLASLYVFVRVFNSGG